MPTAAPEETDAAGPLDVVSDGAWTENTVAEEGAPAEAPVEAPPAIEEAKVEAPLAPPEPEVVAQAAPTTSAEPLHLPERAPPPSPFPDNTPPEYPEEARRASIAGTVIVRLVVNERGEVEEVTVLRGDGAFRETIERTLKQWRYAPAMVQGRPVRVYHVVRIPFRLSES